MYAYRNSSAPIGRRQRRIELYATAALGAVSIGMFQTPPSWAQAILANGMGRSSSLIGNATGAFVTQDIGNSSAMIPPSTTVQVVSPRAIVDWNPYNDGNGPGTPYQFLAAGTTATFYSSSNTPYTVLNIINGGDRPMRFDGTIESRIGGRNGAIGGNVWFYSPGGFLVGQLSPATFNVGGLLLTASSPINSFSDFNDGRNATAQFAAPQYSTSTVKLFPGAQINASDYVALIGPQIIQAGGIVAGGAIGLIAAEQVNLNISADGGLFAISVPLGTSYESPTNAALSATGTTGGGRAGTAAQRNVYMVAVPKNDAVTMLLGGAIGYANNANQSTDGVVVLGGATAATTLGNTVNLPGGDVATQALKGNILIGGATVGKGAAFASNVTVAGATVTVGAVGAGPSYDVSFAGDATIYARTQGFTVGANRTASVGGNLTMISSSLQPDGDLRGGTGTVSIGNGGRLGIVGNLTVDSSGTGFADEQGDGGEATGGTASLSIDRGVLDNGAGGNGGVLRLRADATGGAGGGSGGDATGGTAQLQMLGGTLRMNVLTATATAIGGTAEGDAGGTGQGGTAEAFIQSGGPSSPPTFAVGNVALVADGLGGDWLCAGRCLDGNGGIALAPGVRGGDGLGGTAELFMNAGTASTTYTLVQADGTGAAGGKGVGRDGSSAYYDGGAGGAGSGGTATVTLGGDALYQVAFGSPSGFNVLAGGQGGIGGEARLDDAGEFDTSGYGGAGGGATAGYATFAMNTTAAFVAPGSPLDVTAGASAGRGGNSLSYDGGRGGDTGPVTGRGATIALSDATSLRASALLGDSSAQGGAGGDSQNGAGGNGGVAVAGFAKLVVNPGSSAVLESPGIGLGVAARGGDGGYADNSTYSTGGAATAGTASILLNGGTLNLIATSYTSFDAYAISGAGQGSNGGQVGDATGGNVIVDISGATANLGPFYGTAYGGIPDGDSLIGSTIVGGAVSVLARNAGVITAGTAVVQTNAAAANAYSNPGTAQAGPVSIVASSGGQITFGDVILDASGGGGSYLDSDGQGGAGRGGTVTISADAGAIGLDTLTVNSSGVGGEGPAGGFGYGANILLEADNGGVLASGGSLVANASSRRGFTYSSGSFGGTSGSVTLRANGPNSSLSFTGQDIGIDTTSVGGTAAGDILIAASDALLTLGTSSVIDASADVGSSGIITFRSDGNGSLLAMGDVVATSNGGGAVDKIQIDAVNKVTATSATFNTDQGFSLSNLAPGGLETSGDVTINAARSSMDGNDSDGDTIDAGGSVIITTGDHTIAGDPIVRAANLIDIRSDNRIQAPRLFAGNRIALEAAGDISLTDAQVSVAAAGDGDGGLNPSISTITITAGRVVNTSPPTYTPGSISVGGTVSAGGTVSLTASQTITVDGTVQSGNQTKLSAGNDVLVQAGGAVYGARSPLNNQTGLLSIVARNGRAVGAIGSVINRGYIDGGSGPATITADAFEGYLGGMGGDSVTVGLYGDTPDDNADGQLDPNCTSGRICFGAFTGGALAVDATARRPLTVRLGGPIDAGSLDVSASNGVTLGVNAAAIDTLVAGDIVLDAGAGAIGGLGSGLVRGGTMRLVGASIATPNHAYETTSGDLTIDVPGQIVAASLTSAARLGRTVSGSFVNGLSLSGPLLLTGVLATNAPEGTDVTAAGITIGDYAVGNDAPLRLDAGGNALVIANSASFADYASTAFLRGGSVSVGQLASTGDATIIATSGAATVSTDIAVGGAITASGNSVALTSLGTMNVASLTAGAGGATLQAASQLTVTSGSSGGTLSLRSTGAGLTVGTATATGSTTLDAFGQIGITSLSGGPVSITSAQAGITATSVSSTGTTVLSAPGLLRIDTLSSTGAVTASGGGILIGGGALTFASLNGTDAAGTVEVTTSGALTVNGGASLGAVRLVAGGALTVPTYSAANLTLDGGTVAPFSSLSGANVSLIARGGGLTGQTLIAAGTTALTAPGAIAITSLTSGGGVTASGSGIALTAPGALTVTSATAGAGGLRLRSTNLLTLTAATSGGFIDLASASAGVTIGTTTASGQYIAQAAGPVTATSIGGTGVTLATTAGGIAAQTVASSGATSLSAPGAVAVTTLTSTGAVTATGASVQIGGGSGPLAFTTLTGTTGNVVVTTGGTLAVNGGQAAGSASLTATGAITIPTYSAGLDLTLDGASVGSANSLSGRNLSLTARTGAITAKALAATGTTFLSGQTNVSVQSLTSAGAVTVTGRGVSIFSPGALTFASATAGTGGMTLSATNLLTVTAASSAADAIFESTAAGVTLGTATSTGPTTVNAAGPVAATTINAARIAITTTAGGIAAQTLASGGTTSLSAPGAVSVTSLTSTGAVTASGASVQIVSPGALSFASLSSTSGPVAVTTQTALTVNGGGAQGDATFTAGGLVTLPTYTATGNLTVQGGTLAAFTNLAGQAVSLGVSSGGISGQTLTAGAATALTAPGAVSIASIASTGLVTASGSGVSLTAPGALTANVTAGTGGATLRSAGLLTLTGGTSQSGLALTSTGAGVTVASGTATGAASIAAAGPVAITSLSGGSLSLATTAGTLAAQTLTSGGATSLSAPGALTVTTLTSTGAVTASGGSVQIGGPGPLTFTSLTTTVGDASVTTPGALTIDAANVAGAASFTAGGAVSLGTLAIGTDLTLSGASLPGFTSLTARNVSLTALSGDISAGTLIASGTTALSAPGAVSVTSLSSAGAVTATGGTLSLIAPGSLTIASATAGTGGATLRSAGLLTLTGGTSQGALVLTSTGAGVTIGSASADGAASISAAGPVAVNFLSGANLSLATTAGGLTAQTLASGGTTSLSAPGAVSVTSLTSTGAVTASGASVQIVSPGALSFASLSSTSGPVAVTTQTALTVNGGGAQGDATFTAGGLVTLPTYTATGNLTVQGGTLAVFTSLAGQAVSLGVSSGGISGQTLTAGAATALTAPGAVSIASIASTGLVTASGSGVSLTAPGALTANVTAGTGGATLRSAGLLTLNGGTSQGALGLTSTGAGVTVATAIATGAASIAAAGPVAITSLSGGSLSLATTAGTLTAQTLTSGGATSLSAPGALTVTTLTSTGAVTATGGSVQIDGPGPLTFTALTATTGDVGVTTTGDLAIATGGAAGGGTLAAGGTLTVTRFAAGGDLRLTGNRIGAFTSLSGRDVTLIAAAGGLSGQTLAASGAASLSAPQTIAIAALSSSQPISLTTGAIDITAAQPLTFGTLTATTGDARIVTSGALTLANASAAGDLVLTGTALTATGTLSGRNVALTATGGALTANAVTASGTTTLAATGALSVARLVSTGAVTASGDTIALTAPGALTVASATARRQLTLVAGGDLVLTTGTVTAPDLGSTSSVASTGGNVRIGTLRLGSAPTGVTTLADAGAPADLVITAAQTATLAGPLFNQGAISAAANALVVTGTIDAGTISLASQTITVGPSALIGTLARTGTVTFANSGAGRSFIGGTGGQTGYSLDAAALGRVQASSIALALPRATGGSVSNPDVVIGGLTLYGTGAAAPVGALQNLGAGTLAVTTPGQVQVTGALRLANLPTTGTGGVRIVANGIDIVTPAGSIIQTDAAGVPAGTLELDARLVRAASPSALADLGMLSAASAREARLAQNDGNLSETGWLAANTIRFGYPPGATRSGDAVLYVQNSGGSAAADRRGVTTGTGGVVIAGFPSNDSPEVFINGRSRAADATFVTGSAFLASISQTGAGATDILVNGCQPASGLCTSDLLASPGEQFLFALAPPQDLIGVIDNSSDDDDDDKDKDDNKPGDRVPTKDPNALIQFASADPDATTQPTDEPVVGAGNDSLWSGGNGGGVTGGTSGFDATIGIGNDAGQPGGGQPSASGVNGTTPGQQSSERTPSGNRAVEGTFGVGNDAGQPSAGAVNGTAPGQPSNERTPGNGRATDGGVGIGNDAGAAAGGVRPGTRGGPTVNDTAGGRAAPGVVGAGALGGPTGGDVDGGGTQPTAAGAGTPGGPTVNDANGGGNRPGQPGTGGGGPSAGGVNGGGASTGTGSATRPR